MATLGNVTVLLLPLALAAFWLQLTATFGWRDALLRSMAVLAVSVALLTEILSFFHGLRSNVLFPAWALVCIAVAIPMFRRHSPRPSLSTGPSRSWFDALLVAGIVLIVALIAVTALFSPPNSADAMAYHLPRVIYWAQAASVEFFPTPYLNQVMLQPLAEYFALHTFLLSGTDRYVNLIQWLGFIGCIVGASLIAQALGAGRRGQVLAAFFCATLPSAILQASGAKNDCLLACWLIAMTWFGLRYRRTSAAGDALALCAALSLAMFTKATAYLYAPPMLLAVLCPVLRTRRSHLPKLTVAAALAVLVVNGPQYCRNIDLSSSPLGYDSAHGDGFFRWRNETLGWRATASNVLRNLSEQLGLRSQRWNQTVFELILRTHALLGIDPNDPDTTWRWATFRPPRNSNHEADANNRRHLIAILAGFLVSLWLACRRRPMLLLYLLAPMGAFVLFSTYLKWQPFLSRLLLPLFILAIPVVGVLAEKLCFPFVGGWAKELRFVLPQALLVWFLADYARLPLVENWTRPLEGPRSVVEVSRNDQYFADMTAWNNRESFLESVELVAKSSCKNVGIDINRFQLEYPFQALLRQRIPFVRFVHTGVENDSARFEKQPVPQPCAVLCMDCAGDQAKIERYSSIGEPIVVDKFLLFLEIRQISSEF